MTARLIIKGPGAPDREVTCAKLAMIGRVDSNEIVIRDPKISRHHAMIRCLGDGQYYVMDLGSANGTIINGRRILIPHPLSSGDEISLGDHAIMFRQNEPDAPSPYAAGSDAAKTIIATGNIRQDITVLVMDIRNFVGLSEKIPTDLLANVLGRWFQAANDIVDRHGGVVDKFIGDAVMARWLAGNGGIRWCVDAAIRTAHDMRIVSNTLPEDFPGLPQALRFGAGVTTGEAALGTVGGGTTREFTALGDSVNLAFRLESSSKELGTDLVLDATSYSQLPEPFWAGRVRTISVRGKALPLDVCAVTFDQLAEWLSSA